MLCFISFLRSFRLDYFQTKSVGRAIGSSRSIGGGDIDTSTFLLGACVR